MDFTIHVAKTKALISFAVTARLICVFVFAYAKIRFSHVAAQIKQGVQLRMVLVDSFFDFFFYHYFGLLVATCNLVHDVETIFHLPWLLPASGFFFLKMSDARETANCSFTDINYISEKKNPDASSS